REQQANQDRDDCDHHQQLDQREGRARVRAAPEPVPVAGAVDDTEHKRTPRMGFDPPTRASVETSGWEEGGEERRQNENNVSRAAASIVYYSFHTSGLNEGTSGSCSAQPTKGSAETAGGQRA